MTEFRIQLTTSERGHLVLACDRGHQGECKFSIWTGAPSGAMWHWDGNVERPTVSPSINCHGGCNRHFTLVSGAPT